MLVAVFLSFCVGFMFFIHEPFTMYANNVNDFWFDLSILAKTSLLFFVGFIFLASMVYASIFLMTKRMKKEWIFLLCLIFGNYIFFVFYINSNFLAGFLPSLDGEVINYNQVLPNFLSGLIMIIGGLGMITLIKKFGLKQAVKILSYVDLAILGMLTVSLISTAATTPAFEKKGFLITATEQNLNKISENENFLVLLLDAEDSFSFDTIIQSKQEYKDSLKDFTYFPDTASGYAFTRDSIPFIFSGIWNENQTQFAEYSTMAFNESPLFKRLLEDGYESNFYDADIIWDDERAETTFDNIVSTGRNVKRKAFLKQEMKYLLFKFLPYGLKQYARISSMDFSLAQVREDHSKFRWDNQIFYNKTLAEPLEKIQSKYFSFIHLEGAHVPFDTDEELNPISPGSGTYLQKVEGSINLVQRYLTRLKENDAYNNSTIVILSDHGFWDKDRGRQNPILYIKEKGATFEKTRVSNKQISYEDLAVALAGLESGKSTEEVFAQIPEDGRVRRFIYNGFQEEENMTEYEVLGKAYWPGKEVLVETGRVFRLQD